MKINNKTAIVTICCAAFSANINCKISFNDDLEQEFITKMDQIQQQFQDVTNQMQSTIKNVQEQIISLDNPRTAISPSGLFLNNMQNQNTSHYYQQSSSSLSFANKEKSIKIVEQKDNQKTIYLITVTDKTDDSATTREQSDTVTELQELASYTKKAFRSQQADKVLQECIDAIIEEDKDRVMNIEASMDGNQTKYTIEIAHKEKSDGDKNISAKKQSRKNRKSTKNL